MPEPLTEEEIAVEREHAAHGGQGNTPGWRWLATIDAIKQDRDRLGDRLHALIAKEGEYLYEIDAKDAEIARLNRQVVGERYEVLAAVDDEGLRGQIATDPMAHAFVTIGRRIERHAIEARGDMIRATDAEIERLRTLGNKLRSGAHVRGDCVLVGRERYSALMKELDRG